MSYTFSRRSFLKYTAVAAVAVAGSSLLSGCEIQDPYNPTSKKLGSSLSISNVTGKLLDESNGTSLKDGVFVMNIKSSYGNTIQLNKNNFNLTVTDSEGKIKSSYFATLNYTGDVGLLNDGDEVTVTLSVPDSAYAVEAGDVVTFRYVPVLSSTGSGYSMVWEITVE